MAEHGVAVHFFRMEFLGLPVAQAENDGAIWTDSRFVRWFGWHR
jgi:hypothetical protein